MNIFTKKEISLSNIVLVIGLIVSLVGNWYAYGSRISRLEEREGESRVVLQVMKESLEGQRVDIEVIKSKLGYIESGVGKLLNENGTQRGPRRN